jgi:hypothetical protein
MGDQHEPNQDFGDESQPSSGEAWREVGDQFESLGKSLATAFRMSWNNKEARRHVMSGLESMASEINRAVSEVGSAEEARKLRRDMARAAESARSAGEQTLRETRPRLLGTLRQVNGELKRVIEFLDQREHEETGKTTDESEDI